MLQLCADSSIYENYLKQWNETTIFTHSLIFSRNNSIENTFSVPNHSLRSLNIFIHQSFTSFSIYFILPFICLILYIFSFISIHKSFTSLQYISFTSYSHLSIYFQSPVIHLNHSIFLFTNHSSHCPYVFIHQSVIPLIVHMFSFISQSFLSLSICFYSPVSHSSHYQYIFIHQSVTSFLNIFLFPSH